jgi:tetratricopeptide (TPR) repeat protein
MELSASRRSTAIIIGVFLIVGFLIYARSLGNGFVNLDDGLLIYGNPFIQELSWTSLTHIFTTYDPELYIPLTFVSYQLNHLVGGLDPFGYHLVNLLLHIGNALLVVWIAWLLCKRRWVAVLTGMLFLVHPLHTEAAVQAAARKDTLAAFFFLLSLGNVLFSRERDDRRWYAASVGFFLLALLSKVSVIMLPLAIVIIDWARGRQPLSRRAIIDLIPYVILCLIFGVVAIFGKMGSGSLLLEKILIGAKATAFLLGKLFVPTGLSVLYPYTQPIAISTPDLLWSVLVVIVLSIGTLLLARRNRVPLAAWVLFLLFLLPSFTNIAKGQEYLRDVYFSSDRYAYLPSISIFFLFSLLIDELRRRWGTVVEAVVACVLIALAFLSYRQSFVWKDTETLFTHAVRLYPNAQLGWNYVGGAYYERGDVQGALEQYQQSVAVRPNDIGYFNMGAMYEKLDRPSEAADAYRKAIAINPISMDARVNLGILLMRADQPVEAEKLFREAIQSAPVFAGVRDVQPLLILAYFNLGTVLEEQGRNREAAEAYREVVDLDPEDAEAKQKVTALE